MMHLYVLQQLVSIANEMDKNYGEELATQLESIYNTYHNKGGSFGI